VNQIFRKLILVVSLIIVGFISYLAIGLGIRPTGPYDPLASIDYFFDQTDVSKELVFNPRFCKNHEIAIVSSPPVSATEHFTWRLRTEVFKFGVKIQDKELTEETRTFASGAMDKHSAISFGWIRTLDMLPGKVIVKIHVEKGDTSTSIYRDNFKVVVRPSPIM